LSDDEVLWMRAKPSGVQVRMVRSNASGIVSDKELDVQVREGTGEWVSVVKYRVLTGICTLQVPRHLRAALAELVVRSSR
jgi:hypothetical protein